jgi:hypothetical protein
MGTALVLLGGIACSSAGQLSTPPSSTDASLTTDAESAAPNSPEDAQPKSPDVQPQARPATGYVDPLLTNSQEVPTPTREGAQYSGAVALRSVLATGAPTGQAWIEISAPILPKTPALYAGQGANYPTTPKGQAQLAHDSALTFETLLAECQPSTPGIVLWHPGDPPLSNEQVSTNYRLLEQCAYQQYMAKPYWIPQLVKDVDICLQELGAGWHTLTENDVLALTAQDLQQVQEVLAGVQSAGASAGSFLFSRAVWVLRNDGSVAGANLEPNASPRFFALTSSNGMSFDPLVHYEGSLALRCLRVSTGE